MWNENTYPFTNFNGCTIEVWEWISTFPIVYLACDYLSMLQKLRAIYLHSALVVFEVDDVASLTSVPVCPTVDPDIASQVRWVHVPHFCSQWRMAFSKHVLASTLWKTLGWIVDRSGIIRAKTSSWTFFVSNMNMFFHFILQCIPQR